jgi:hypothetical protein
LLKRPRSVRCAMVQEGVFRLDYEV